jgi:hypothetical protein
MSIVATLLATVLLAGHGNHTGSSRTCGQDCNDVVKRCRDGCAKAKSHAEECKKQCDMVTEACLKACTERARQPQRD